jgi:hypothetical protein
MFGIRFPKMFQIMMLDKQAFRLYWMRVKDCWGDDAPIICGVQILYRVGIVSGTLSGLSTAVSYEPTRHILSSTAGGFIMGLTFPVTVPWLYLIKVMGL